MRKGLKANIFQQKYPGKIIFIIKGILEEAGGNGKNWGKMGACLREKDYKTRPGSRKIKLPISYTTVILCIYPIFGGECYEVTEELSCRVMPVAG
jgi:hypothetical protein